MNNKKPNGAITIPSDDEIQAAVEFYKRDCREQLHQLREQELTMFADTVPLYEIVIVKKRIARLENICKHFNQ